MNRIQELAWLAGFIDGDGYICLHQRRDSVADGYVGLCQKETRLIDYVVCLVQELGLPQPTRRLGRGDVTYLQFNSQNGNLLLGQLLPLLRHPRKKVRAELYQKFYSADTTERRQLWQKWLYLRTREEEIDTECFYARETDLPWLAGFFDAEGWLSIIIDKRGYFNGQLGIMQKSEKTLLRIVDVLERRKIESCQYLDRISLSGHKAKLLCHLLLPYLHHPEKQRRAELYIKFFAASTSKRGALWNDWCKKGAVA